MYRPPNPNNMNTFFDETTACLNKAAVKYENIIIVGDFNIDIKIKNWVMINWILSATFSTLQT